MRRHQLALNWHSGCSRESERTMNSKAGSAFWRVIMHTSPNLELPKVSRVGCFLLMVARLLHSMHQIEICSAAIWHASLIGSYYIMLKNKRTTCFGVNFSSILYSSADLSNDKIELKVFYYQELFKIEIAEIANSLVASIWVMNHQNLCNPFVYRNHGCKKCAHGPRDHETERQAGGKYNSNGPIGGLTFCNIQIWRNTYRVRKNTPTKPTIGKWSSLLILQQQLSHDQNKIKNENILKWNINEF